MRANGVPRLLFLGRMQGLKGQPGTYSSGVGLPSLNQRTHPQTIKSSHLNQISLCTLPESWQRKTTQSVRIWITQHTNNRLDTPQVSAECRAKTAAGPQPTYKSHHAETNGSTRAPSPGHSGPKQPRAPQAAGPGRSLTRARLEVSSFFSLLILGRCSPLDLSPRLPVTVVSTDSSTLMVGVLGLLLLLGSRPLRRPQGARGVLIRSAVGACELFAPSYNSKSGDIKVKFYSSFWQRRKEEKDWVSMLVRLISICFSQASHI